MTKHINYTSDRVINRDLNELDRIEAMLKPYRDKVDYNNINLAHVMLKEEQKRLQESTANFTDRQNPLKGRQSIVFQSSSGQQPLGEQKHFLLSSKSDNNTANESSVTNPDGSITITRERQTYEGGTMGTQTGRIRLMPQYESAGGAPAVIGGKIKDQMLNLSESEGGKEVIVSSGTRTEAQNEALRQKGVNAARKSPHLSSNAADIGFANKTGVDTINSALNCGMFSRVNLYSSGAVHVDNMPRRVGQSPYFNNWRNIPLPQVRDKPVPPTKRK